MKYKLIIIFFNIFMLLSFLALFFLPVSVLGWNYIADFWGQNWILPLVFIVLIAALNVFFISSWSILKYAEKGDWGSLVPVLEQRIFEKKFITYSNVRLLVHSYLLLNKTDSLGRLENHIRKSRKRLYNRTFLMFCSGHLLSDKPEDLENYLENAWNDKSLKGREWVTINYVFSLIVQNKFSRAMEMINTLDDQKYNPVIRLTIIYLKFLGSSTADRESVIRLKDDFVKSVKIEKFENTLEIEKGDMHVLFFSKVIEQAKSWAYADSSSS